jgi:hypothetical protein
MVAQFFWFYVGFEVGNILHYIYNKNKLINIYLID